MISSSEIPQAGWMPFLESFTWEEISADSKASAADAITIIFGQAGAPATEEALQIESASGARTRVSFRLAGLSGKPEARQELAGQKR